VPFAETLWSRIEADTGACSSVAGVSGYRLSQYLASARARLAAPGARYELVLLALYVGNDLTDDAEAIPPAKDVQRRPLRLLPAGLSAEAVYDWFYPMNAWLESCSHAYVAVRFAIRRFRDPGDAGIYGVSRALRRSMLTPQIVDETVRGVRLIGEAARAHGARVLVVVIPERTQVLDPDGAKILRAMPALEGDLDMDLTSRELVPRLAALGEVQRVIDLLPILRANADPANWGVNDGHFSPQGHARVFEALREPVRELLGSNDPTPK
jgi:lysophospholipase L1-like esterase